MGALALCAVCAGVTLITSIIPEFLTQGQAMGDKDAAAKVDLGLLEEDDEFEEFPADETETKGEDTTVNVWEDNWDDDKKEDDFANQLKSELQSHGSRMEH